MLLDPDVVEGYNPPGRRQSIQLTYLDVAGIEDVDESVTARPFQWQVLGLILVSSTSAQRTEAMTCAGKLPPPEAKEDVPSGGAERQMGRAEQSVRELSGHWNSRERCWCALARRGRDRPPRSETV